jgi:hypothetical protein
MDLAKRLEKKTPARFAVESSTTGTLNKIVLKDSSVGYRSFIHILADKGEVAVSRAKEELALDYITSEGAVYVNQIKEHKNEAFGGRGRRGRVHQN